MKKWVISEMGVKYSNISLIPRKNKRILLVAYSTIPPEQFYKIVFQGHVTLTPTLGPENTYNCIYSYLIFLPNEEKIYQY